MKPFSIILLFVLFSVQSYGQKFSIMQLYEMLKSGYEIFDTKALEKGFEFDSAYNTEKYTAYHYTLERTQEGKATEHLSWTSWKDGLTYISYQISKAKEYLDFKNQLKKLGFKLIKTETVNGNLFLDYKFGNKLVTLSSGKANNDGGLRDFYEISVEYSK